MPIGGIGPGGTSSAGTPMTQGSGVGGKVKSTLSSAAKGAERFMTRIGGTLCHGVPSAISEMTWAVGQSARATREQWSEALFKTRQKRAAEYEALVAAQALAQARARSVPKVQVSGPMTPEETMAAIRATNASAASRPLTDADIARNLGKEGVGASMNDSVSAKLYNRFVGGSNAIKGFFKPNSGKLPNPAGTAKIISVEELDRLDGEATNDAQLAIRAVASSVVNRLLGTNVVAESAFAEVVDEHGNVVKGYVSAAAPGKQLYISNAAAAAAAADTTWNDIDYRNPAVQRGLSDLQVNDWITGQIDRHGMNIFVDQSSGQVTGIDNDLAFGERVATTNREGEFVMPIQYNKQMPRMVDFDTAKRILALQPQQLRKELSQLTLDGDRLPSIQIEAAVQRLLTLQRAIKNHDPRMQVVQVWNDETYNTAAQGIDRATSTTASLQDQVETKEFGDGTGIFLRSILAWRVASEIEPLEARLRDAILNTLQARGLELNESGFRTRFGRLHLPIPEYQRMLERARTTDDPMNLLT